MMNMANGGMGGGVASALARALGAGRHEDARALVLHALLLGLGCALVFTVFAWTALPSIFAGWAAAAMSCSRRSPSARLVQRRVVLWTQRFLSALLRGAGNAATPAASAS
jgi:Na+-driven multidrug efflux pump